MELRKDRVYYQNYRIKLHNLREDQKQRIEKLSYARRFLYNWALEYSNAEYKRTGKVPPYQAVARKFTELKHSDLNFQWLNNQIYNVTTCRYAFIDLAKAFHNFITGKCNRPIFKHRKTDSIRIAIRSNDVTFKGEDGRYAFIPGISMRKGDLIDCGNHNIPHYKGIKYENTRIKFDGIDYWLSLSIKTTIPDDNSIELTDEVIGIDIGVRTAAALSNGISFNGPNKRKLKTLENRLRKIQSAVDRDIGRRMKISTSTRTKYYDIQKSKNQLKRETKLAKTRNKIINIYRSRYHKISREIANMHPSAIVLEDLSAAKIVANAVGKERRNALYQARMSTLSTYIAYKCDFGFTKVIYADRDFPSSQICSNCGYRQSIGRSKIYRCPNCGVELDRDYNAAVNLRNYGLSVLNAT